MNLRPLRPPSLLRRQGGRELIGSAHTSSASAKARAALTSPPMRDGRGRLGDARWWPAPLVWAGGTPAHVECPDQALARRRPRSVARERTRPSQVATRRAASPPGQPAGGQPADLGESRRGGRGLPPATPHIRLSPRRCARSAIPARSRTQAPRPTFQSCPAGKGWEPESGTSLASSPPHTPRQDPLLLAVTRRRR